MKNINIRLLLQACVLASMGFLMSCDDDNENGTSEVQLLSFGPAGVQHGDEIVVIGNNLDKITEIEFQGASVPKTAFTSQNAGRITLVVPQEVEEGPIKLKTANEEILSKTIFSLEVPVEVQSFTAEAKPGENLTITGSFVNWIREVWFAEDVMALEVVSKSLNELVVKIPLEAQSGQLVFLTGGTEPLTIKTEDEITLTLPAATNLSPNPIERGTELTITGTDLDLVKAVNFKGNVSVDEAAFVSKSPTEIVLVFPEDANKGTIELVAYSGVTVESAQALTVSGDLPPLDALALAFYTDAFANGWQKWGGWGSGSSDAANAENVRDGEKSVKVIFGGGWGGSFQMGGGNSSTAGYDHFAISIYGDAGTGGKQLNLILKDGGATTEKIITIVEGEWTEYKFSISGDLGGIATITEMFLQDRDWSGTLYVDHIGLR